MQNKILQGIDISGKKFGNLTAIKYISSHKEGYSKWLFKCDCGKEVVKIKGGVTTGNTKSCGCLHTKSVVKHRLSNTSIYNIWDSMIQRCTNKNNIVYKRYGGNGIKVCSRWLSSFQNFLSDMGERPTNKHSIDRINNKKGYSKKNCRWATSKEQNINRRTVKIVEINGIKKCLSDWCKEYKIGTSTVSMRIKNGWTPKKAITTRVGEVGRWKK